VARFDLSSARIFSACSPEIAAANFIPPLEAGEKLLFPEDRFATIAEYPRVTAWRAALAARERVIAAVAGDYTERFRQHLRLHQAVLAD
jgi:hypothetical protein